MATTSSIATEKLEVSFTNGALAQIKSLAEYFLVPETELKNVIIKGLQVMAEVKKSGNRYVIVEDTDGKREKIDISAI